MNELLIDRKRGDNLVITVKTECAMCGMDIPPNKPVLCPGCRVVVSNPTVLVPAKNIDDLIEFLKKQVNKTDPEEIRHVSFVITSFVHTVGR